MSKIVQGFKEYAPVVARRLAIVAGTLAVGVAAVKVVEIVSGNKLGEEAEDVEVLDTDLGI